VADADAGHAHAAATLADERHDLRTGRPARDKRSPQHRQESIDRPQDDGEEARRHPSHEDGAQHHEARRPQDRGASQEHDLSSLDGSADDQTIHVAQKATLIAADRGMEGAPRGRALF
jgi:hypothetical protein